MKNMKKYIAIVLSVLMLTALFAACSNGDKEGGKSNNEIPSAFEGRLMEPYIDLILSKNYTFETTPKTETPITFVQYGEDQKMLSLNVELEGGPTAVTYMLKDGTYYLLTAADKNYTELSPSQVKKLKVEELFNNASLEKFPNASFVGTGSATISGVEYTYEDYYNPLVQVKNRYFFNEDGTLTYMARLNDKGKTGTKIPVSVLETNPTVFDVLNDYNFIEQAPTKKAANATTRKAS
ncbi:MAG: hypothetical protein ILO43_04935 [Clostridia bacterium]|nr:hypothetical protein [Clostridia bacterium]MBP5272292.1 hypothetical protein [Clostridia bacterium]MBP5458740.1 hypothetical protein [Clostridia bacterium]